MAQSEGATIEQEEWDVCSEDSKDASHHRTADTKKNAGYRINETTISFLLKLLSVSILEPIWWTL